MDLLINYYNETFMKGLENCTEYEVEITHLTEYVNCLSPIGVNIILKYSDENECFKKISAAIIKNFSANYADERWFPRFGIDAMTNIMNRNDEVGKVRQILLLHASKAYFATGTTYAAEFFKNASTMEMDELNDDLREWALLADKAIQHEEINGIVEQSILEYYQKMPSQPSGQINVQFFSNDMTHLRGFSGINSVYFNKQHFFEKRQIHESKMKEDVTFRNNVNLMLKIDIIALAIHEFSHVRLRQVTDNLNTSTSLVMKDSGLPLVELDFGRMMEIKIFGYQIDWFLSLKHCNKEYIRDFISAIENKTKLPEKNKIYGVIIRPPPVVKGMDMEDMESVFE